ncbi:MAG: hypothetical protein K5839_00850, partial [Treponemataceae bacterium]|nr:hypothetical protein [Treponemataceae bacterium]
MTSLGNEASVRTRRGDRFVPYKIPEDVKDFDDRDDFLLGLPLDSDQPGENSSGDSSISPGADLLSDDPKEDNLDVDDFDISSFTGDTSSDGGLNLDLPDGDGELFDDKGSGEGDFSAIDPLAAFGFDDGGLGAAEVEKEKEALASEKTSEEDPLAGLSDLGDAAAEAESGHDPLAGLGDISTDDNAFAGLDDLESPDTESSTEEDPLAGLSDLGDAATEVESNDDPFAGLGDVSSDDNAFEGLGDLESPETESSTEEDPLAGLSDLGDTATEAESGHDPLAGLGDISTDDNAFAGLDDLECPDTESSTEEYPLAGLTDLGDAATEGK